MRRLIHHKHEKNATGAPDSSQTNAGQKGAAESGGWKKAVEEGCGAKEVGDYCHGQPYVVPPLCFAEHRTPLCSTSWLHGEGLHDFQTHVLLSCSVARGSIHMLSETEAARFRGHQPR